jgi:hypothetical protein
MQSMTKSPLPPWLEHSRYLLIDSNLLVVLIVGRVAIGLLGKESVKDYHAKDYELLLKFVSQFEGYVTTQAILAETNALLTKTGAWARNECWAALAEQIPLFAERCSNSSELAKNPDFSRFGLTDISIKAAASDDTLVLSADWPLVGLLRANGIAALHYEELAGSW